MRVLVATNERQGTAPGDYSFTVEGELVLVDLHECSHPQRCGCGRGFAGVASRRATTTAMVVELAHLTRADLLDVVIDQVTEQWGDLLTADAGADGAAESGFGTVEEQLADIADGYVEDIEEICRSFPVGTVVERSGTLVSARAFPTAA